MNAIRIHRQLESQVIDLPEIASLIGKRVEIIVLEDGPELETVSPTANVSAFGCGKGQGRMAPDFDETPEDFAEYL